MIQPCPYKKGSAYSQSRQVHLRPPTLAIMVEFENHVTEPIAPEEFEAPHFEAFSIGNYNMDGEYTRA